MSETKWTKNVPTEKGYYWVFDPSRSRSKMFLIWFENHGMMKIFGGAWVGSTNIKNAYYSARIEQPEPPQGISKSDERQ